VLYWKTLPRNINKAFGTNNMPEAAAIPIIDISAEGADELEVAKALVDAAAEYGFVYIKNSGKDISAEQVQNAFDIVSEGGTYIGLS
jgi:sialic acid synthase SpsE